MGFEGYGQSRLFPAAHTWRDGQAETVLRWPPPRRQFSSDDEASRIAEPSVYTIMLGLKRDDQAAAGRHLWRWNLQFGVGGARQAFRIDALGSQLICVPLESAEISIVNERLYASASYVEPDYPVTAYAYIARGSTSTQPARFTSYVSTIATNLTDTVYIPTGATGFRVHGDSANDGASASTKRNPLTADIKYILSLNSSNIYDTWYGDDLADLHRGAGFLPLVGGARSLTIENNSLEWIQPIVMWEIDF